MLKIDDEHLQIFNKSNTIYIINELKKDKKELYEEIKKNILKQHPDLISEYNKIETYQTNSIQEIIH